MPTDPQFHKLDNWCNSCRKLLPLFCAAHTDCVSLFASLVASTVWFACLSFTFFDVKFLGREYVSYTEELLGGNCCENV